MASSSFFESQKDEDTFWLIIAGPLLIASGFFAPMVESVRLWLIEHHIIVTEAVLLPLPGGAGLDLPRVLLLAAVLALAITITTRVLIARYKKKRLARMIEGDDE